MSKPEIDCLVTFVHTTLEVAITVTTKQFTPVLESWMRNTVEYGEDEVQYDAARGRRRVVDGVVAISQCHVNWVLETAHVAFKVSQGHVPTCSVIVNDGNLINSDTYYAPAPTGRRH